MTLVLRARPRPSSANQFKTVLSVICCKNFRSRLSPLSFLASAPIESKFGDREHFRYVSLVRMFCRNTDIKFRSSAVEVVPKPHRLTLFPSRTDSTGNFVRQFGSVIWDRRCGMRFLVVNAISTIICAKEYHFCRYIVAMNLTFKT